LLSANCQKLTGMIYSFTQQDNNFTVISKEFNPETNWSFQKEEKIRNAYKKMLFRSSPNYTT
jgi:hypothetical protein